MELPSIPTDVPLSRTGSLYLLSTMAASSALFDAPASLPSLSLVPDFAAILASSLGDAETGSTGAAPEPLIDAVLFLGSLIVNSKQGPPPDHYTGYYNLCKPLSLLSANIPSPALRYHAHILTSSMLRGHLSDDDRMAFISSTLTDWLYPNLKASAIGWLKDEILAAERTAQAGQSTEETSVFATPDCLTTLAPFLFVSADTRIEGLSHVQGYEIFKRDQGFYSAVLNFIYLLISSPALSSRLQVAKLIQERGVHSWYLNPILSYADVFSTSIRNGEFANDDIEENDAALASMDLLVMQVEEVQDAMAKAGISFQHLPSNVVGLRGHEEP